MKLTKKTLLNPGIDYWEVSDGNSYMLAELCSDGPRRLFGRDVSEIRVSDKPKRGYVRVCLSRACGIAFLELGREQFQFLRSAGTAISTKLESCYPTAYQLYEDRSEVYLYIRGTK